MRFVIVTGMSGGGKRTAMKMLEDVGFYCVDNLPIQLMDKFIELVTMPNNEIQKVALGIDVRTDQNFEDVLKILSDLKKANYQYELIFMEASDSILIKRYKESRRLHPLATDGDIAKGIAKEREVLAGVRAQADYVIDTTNLLTRELKEEIDRIFINNEAYNSLMVSIISFGFKHGIPQDADLVFDVRFLPNPFYIDELKHQTGIDKPVQDYVMAFEEANIFLNKLTDMIQFLIPNYVKEGKNQLVIGIGCTGGQHRSVTLAIKLFEKLKDQGEYGLTLRHRDAS